ncbi:MAG: hypothetical protein AABX82_01775, partial [Nanoarchaeota archaeon]
MKKTFISLVSIIAACSQEPSVSREVAPSIIEVVPPYSNTIAADETNKATCDSQREELFGAMLYTDGTELQVLNSLIKKDQDPEFIERQKEYFAEDASDVAANLVWNFREPWSPIKRAKREELYDGAKALAYCLDPKVNFEEAVVSEAYKGAAAELKSGVIEKVITRTLRFAKEVASKNGINDSSYARQFVIDAYANALYHLERGYVERFVQADFKFARKVAKDNKVDDEIYARDFVDQACKIAEMHHS